MNEVEMRARIEMLEAGLLQLVRQLPEADGSQRFVESLRGLASNISTGYVLNTWNVRLQGKNIDGTAFDSAEAQRLKKGAFGD